jgi:hypothetical protein
MHKYILCMNSYIYMNMIKTRHKHVESGMMVTSYTILRHTLVVGGRESGDSLSHNHTSKQPLGIPVARPTVAIVV